MLLLLLLVFFSYGPRYINPYTVGECGIRRLVFSPSIAYGVPSKLNEFPWHTALYRMDNSFNYEYICGGSIITSNIVLTAAHCVFDEEKQGLDNSIMVIATGKHNVSWEHRDVWEQRLEVISKKVTPYYRGADYRYQDDIALLTLNDSIKFSSITMPICIDWVNLNEPVDEEIGTIVGWGYDENNVRIEIPEASLMQCRNFVECLSNVGKGYKSFLTSDKFCALGKNETTVEQGDSGGGLMFLRHVGINKTEPRYFIYGVLSGREKDSKSYVIFTNISNHMPWLNRTTSKIIAETDRGKVCGIRHKVGYLAQDGSTIKGHTDYPWLATIYMTKKNKFFGIRCVGTIIHQRAIITSVWCIEDQRPLYEGVEYKILLGKHELDMRQSQQEFSIARIHKNENEMAILIVDREIEFTDTVAPICIDWEGNFPLATPSTGLIVSWDLDECHCQKVASYKFLNIQDCSQPFHDKEEYQTHLTSKKICGRYINGTRFKYGSAVGSGYVFMKNGSTRHYLQGIVSKGRPFHQEFLTFINVELNLRWISYILVNIYNTGSW